MTGDPPEAKSLSLLLGELRTQGHIGKPTLRCFATIRVADRADKRDKRDAATGLAHSRGWNIRLANAG